MRSDLADQFLCLADFEPAARHQLPHAVYEYVSGAAGDEITMRGNVAAFDRLRIRPRVLRDVSKIDTGITVFGDKLSHPILLAPTSFQRMSHPEGEVASARGAGEAGAIFTLSTSGTATIEECVSASQAPIWFLMYWQSDRSFNRDVVAQVTLPATIDALPAIAERVAGRIPVVIDGGIRRGTDVLKSIALGATAVMIGRPYVYALAVGGSDGVRHCIELLRQEFEMAMALTGRASISEIDRSLIW